MARFQLPRVRGSDNISTKDGRAASSFVQFWDRICRQIEGQENNQNDLIAQLQAMAVASQLAQQAANDAQTTADGAAGVSGYAENPSVDVPSAAWVTGPQVDLTGVVAGNLTITGSGPQQDSDVTLFGAGSMICNFRIVEVVGGVDTVLFTGSFSAVEYAGTGNATITNNSAAAVASFVSARTSTGAVSYRIDAQGTGARFLSNLSLYIFARRV